MTLVKNTPSRYGKLDIPLALKKLPTACCGICTLNWSNNNYNDLFQLCSILQERKADCLAKISMTDTAAPDISKRFQEHLWCWHLRTRKFLDNNKQTILARAAAFAFQGDRCCILFEVNTYYSSPTIETAVMPESGKVFVEETSSLFKMNCIGILQNEYFSAHTISARVNPSGVWQVLLEFQYQPNFLSLASDPTS